MTTPTPNIIIALATAADIPDIIRVVKGVYHEYGFIFIPEEEIPDLLTFEQNYRPPRGVLFVGKLDGKTIGSVGVKLIDPGAAEIFRLYLDSAFRGLGMGRRLLDTAISWSKENGARKITLWSDTRFTLAHQLYLRSGFAQGSMRKLNDPNRSVEYQFNLALASIDDGDEPG